jgi:SAM-dependent methyltransferase
MQDEEIVAEFTHQAETFNTSVAARDVPTLEEIMRLAAPRTDERWLEVACGPGILSRQLAARANAVHGVDKTPAMIEVARREAAAAGIGNATFAVGDATAMNLPTASVDGAIARFAIHHIPAPVRMVQELARVVRPGGRIILADHVADAAPDAAAWSQEIERLRDPSHWASLPVARLRTLGSSVGLSLESEKVRPAGARLRGLAATRLGGPWCSCRDRRPTGSTARGGRVLSHQQARRSPPPEAADLGEPLGQSPVVASEPHAAEAPFGTTTSPPEPSTAPQGPPTLTRVDFRT